MVALTLIFANEMMTGTAKKAYATQAIVNAFPMEATNLVCPSVETILLKSWAAFSNHMRAIRKDVIPMRNPKKPIKAVKR